jgi:hypothetical protein
MTVEDFFVGLGDEATPTIVIDSDLTAVPSFTLPPGKSLLGGGSNVRMLFNPGEDGVILTSDNTIANLGFEVDEECCAIANDTSVANLGRIMLLDVTTVGRVRILARDAVRAGHVDVDGLSIVGADTRAQTERPQGYGVGVLQGAFTLWNMQPDAKVEITADLVRLSAGRPDAPVHGSGVFISGGGDEGGRLTVDRLETGAVYSDGGIAEGTPDQISGGVFNVHGSHVRVIRNHDIVETFGANDMVLDNWGTVDIWIAHGPLISHGPSGIGIVNFGTVHELRVDATIETHGKGARGFNVYNGTVDNIEFNRIVTHGDGAVGIQLSQPIGRMLVRNGIETFGGSGESLVKGVVTQLPATALSLKPGSKAALIEIVGGLVTHGDGIPRFEMHGSVEILHISERWRDESSRSS